MPDQPVLVRNEEAGPSVFTDANTKVAIEWQGKGDKGGEDIQYVPAEILRTPSFMRAITRGIYVVLDPDEDTRRALEQQAGAYRNRQEHIAAEASQSIDGSSEADVAAATIGTMGQVQQVPTITGVKTPSSDSGSAEETEEQTRVIIDPSTHSKRVTQ